MDDPRAPTGDAEAPAGPAAYADLAAVSALAVAVVAAVLTASPDAGVALALPLFAVGPGYGFVLFVEYRVGARNDSEDRASLSSDDAGPETEAEEEVAEPRKVGPLVRRTARVVAASLLVVSVGGAALYAVGLPTDAAALAGWAALTTVAFAAAAGFHRHRRNLPGPSLPALASEGSWPVGLFAVSAVFLLVTGGYLALFAPTAEGFTEFSVQPANGSDGGALADPEFVPGEETALELVVANQERERTEYTVVARVEEVQGSGDDATVVSVDDEQRFSLSVSRGESGTVTHEFVPPASNARLRAAYYLYRGDAAEEVSRTSAYRTVVVWEREPE